jgi:hypothetical protein
VITRILRKSVLAITFAFLTSAVGKPFVSLTAPTVHPSFEMACPGGGDPDPCANGTCIADVHLA